MYLNKIKIAANTIIHASKPLSSADIKLCEVSLHIMSTTSILIQIFLTLGKFI